MKNYCKASHSIYDIKYHFVWITKYCKPILTGDISPRARELIREICKTMDIEIIKGHISKDHVHLLLFMPSFISASDVMKRIKGKTSRKLLSESRILEKILGSLSMGSRIFLYDIR